MIGTVLNIEKISFEDEVVEHFFYSSKNNRIEIAFEAFYSNEKYVENCCELIVESWEKAYSQIHGSNKVFDLEAHLGIPSMILSLEKNENTILMTLNTVDNRYINLTFIGASVRVEAVASSVGAPNSD